MSLNDLVHATISTDVAGLKQAGFGVQLLLDYHTNFTERARYYEELSGLTGDGFNTYDPLYKMASRAFSQDPRPEKVLVGRLENPYTQTIKWTPLSITAGDDQTMTIEVDGVILTAEYTNAVYSVDAACTVSTDVFAAAGHTLRLNDIVRTADVGTLTGISVDTDYHVITVVAGVSFKLSATQGGASLAITGTDDTITLTRAPLAAADIIDGMVIAVQALDDFDSSLTVTNQTTYMRIVTSVGKVAHYSDWSGKYEDVTTNTGSGGIAAELDAILLENDDWYGANHALAAKAITQPMAAWIEANTRLFTYRDADWQNADAGSSTDIFFLLEGLSYGRSAGYPRKHATGDYIDVGAMAERFTHDPGVGPGAGGTWFGKTIVGVLADDWTPTEKAALRDKNANVYINTAGRSHTLDGKVAGGEYIDVVRFLDWTNARIQETIATSELDAERVPFTDQGISLIGKDVQSILDIGVQAGGWSNDPYPVVSLPKAKDVSKADKAARRLRNVKWSATLAGAIQLSDVDGTAL